MSDSAAIEVRSYRDVFALERRIYRVDRLRLNPGGVPIRGVLYGIALVCSVLMLAALPLTGWVLAVLPWYLRDVVLPVGTAALLTVTRLEGRAFHIAAYALSRHRLCARGLCALSPAPSPRPGQMWQPPELLLLPDGSDSRLRRVRFSGPGGALVAVAHECSVRPGLLRQRGSRLVVRALGPSRPLARGRVLAVDRGARIDVHRAR
jgi:hypothetical protein